MIDKIKKYHLCVGCGLCASVLGKETCEMTLNSLGFYEPVLNKPLSVSDSKRVKELCPGIHVEAKPHKGVWGSMHSICEAWSSDSQIRHNAASGGVVTSLAIYVLEHHLADAVLQVGVKFQEAERTFLKTLNRATHRPWYSATSRKCLRTAQRVLHSLASHAIWLPCRIFSVCIQYMLTG